MRQNFTQYRRVAMTLKKKVATPPPMSDQKLLDEIRQQNPSGGIGSLGRID
jgi:hypothetical protein